ncbi:vacuolar protein sorting-associated protein 16 homolog isoform X2 [Varroa jacobsoni]|uniref:Vacuolar protein sorting-associated protein 16 homolog n=1 Tax=Varroa destructor TaxID=109461 RepID=A0A7M7JSR2_VARDE|nr:vacuolar protein sorting-associated protein 16 homolog isoform X2 [Varroa destructor]XP_022693328.1 vacuolar protein sorting-associated protein 16 homolog isoform X2 [Varroa jacobsoni]
MPEDGLSASVRSDWKPLGTDVNFRKFEIYEMQWHTQVHLQDFIVAAAPFGGAIALLRTDRRCRPGGEQIQVHSAAGQSIKKISEELIVVGSDGSVHVFPFDPHVIRVKYSFTLGKEAKDAGVIDTRVFNTRHNQSTGVVVLTGSYRFILVKSLHDPRTNELPDIGLSSMPSCWQVVSIADSLKVLVAKDNLIYVINANDRSIRQFTGLFDSKITAITEMALSFNHKLLALFSDTGAIWIGTSDLIKGNEHNTKTRSRPRQFVWCGKDGVVATWANSMVLVGFEQQDIRYTLEGDDTTHIVAEPDGCRVITNIKHYFLQKVPIEVDDLFNIGSFAPGRLLLEAADLYRKGSHLADQYLTLIKEDDGQLEQAVDQCIRATGHQWDEESQKALLKAASFGKVFQPIEGKNRDQYVNMCKHVRVLNAIRSPQIGMPLSFRQFEALGESVVIDRLIVRQHWPMAQAISSYLKLNMENKILVHWACYKVEQKHLNTNEVATAIGTRLSTVRAMQYSEIANRAADEGRKDLAVRLLDFEPRAAEQVPLLLKLNQPEDALSKAVDSGDADLVYQAIFYMKEHASAGFNLKLRQFPVAMNLYQKLCRENDREKLEDLIDQEDDHAAMAKIKIEDAMNASRKEQKIAAMQLAAEHLRRTPDEFGAHQLELHIKLLRSQMKFEQKLPSLKLFDLHVNDTLMELLKVSELRAAEEIKKEFAVSDRRWMWLRAKVLAKQGQWDELEKLSKQKRVPLIGFQGFAELCLTYQNKMEALKYILKLKEDPKVNYVLRYTDGDIKKAAALAHEQKDVECLQLLREKAIEKAKTAYLANEIDEYILRLKNKK